jgi:hypothetical protein
MTSPRADTPHGRTAPTADPGPPARPHTRTEDAQVLVDAAVLDLIRRPYLAEILAALDQQPHTLATLRHTTHASRRQAVATLRALCGGIEGHGGLVGSPPLIGREGVMIRLPNPHAVMPGTRLAENLPPGGVY